MTQPSSSTAWSIERSRALYHLPGWGAGYFDINQAGHLTMIAGGRAVERGVDLPGLTERIRAEGFDLPVLVRFEDILDGRIDELCRAFDDARRACDFPGAYTAIYPVKVNQQRSVVEQIVAHGGERIGLEAGSKAELLAVLATSRPGGVIVCNGYKDRDFIRLALMAQLLGHRVYIVIEKPGELARLFTVAAELGVEPALGVRVRLASVARGNWQNSGGEKSKFGLTAAQALDLVSELKAAGKLHWLRLLHFHMGSQLPDINDIQRGVEEAARYLGELHRLGAMIRVFDAGGGLGVDYEGTGSDHYCSTNYTLQDYAGIIVRTLARICLEQGMSAVEIFTEAGRAMTAHHAVLISQVVDMERHSPCDAGCGIFQDLADRVPETSAESLLEEADRRLASCHADFSRKPGGIEARAGIEADYSHFRQLLAAGLAEDAPLKQALTERLADKCFLNFSLFQSVPDVWALGQIFPVLPLQRLDETPRRNIILEDLTCDSDGRIDGYAHGGGVHKTLPLHEPHPGESCLLGIFMVGAYQEILGDMHNLFGDTHAINVRLLPDGGYTLHGAEPGDTAADLLRYVHFNANRLMRDYHKKIARAGLAGPVRRQLTDTLNAALNGYSYLYQE